MRSFTPSALTIRPARRSGRLGRLAVLPIALVLASGWLLQTTASAPSIAVSTIEGQPIVEGRTMRVRGDSVTVAGTSEGGVVLAPLVVDAGDSSFVEAGAPARLIGSASVGGNAEGLTFAWTFDGDDQRFADPTAFDTTFDTTGLDGPVVLTFTVTDADGRTASDDVKLFVWSLVTTTVLDETAEADAGVPEEYVDPSLSGAVDGANVEFSFAVPANARTLDVELSWTQYDPTTADVIAVNDFDLYVDDPSDVEDDNDDGATAARPERIAVLNPAAGDWTAISRAFLNSSDTLTIKAVTTAAPADPVPSIDAGPFSFAVGAPQALTATVSGGTAPLEIEWDLDRDGVFDAGGAAVTSDLPIGTNMVLAKVTDAAGYERRIITPVRVGVAADAESIVVVGVSDSGLNVYHRDFNVSTYRDEKVLALTDNFTKHPSTYLPGYPEEAPAKNLTFGTPFAAGQLYPAADADEWTKAKMPNNTLVWFPGTKIIGAIDASDRGPVNGNADTTPLLDDDGHGTASASVAVGNLYGYCPQCLLFFVEGLSGDVLMYDYEFIDLASNSHGSLGNVGFAGLSQAAQPKAAAERGQIAMYAAGNGNENAFLTPEQTYTSESLGADWLVRVGAVDKTTRKPIIGTGKPVDISSWGIGSSSGPDSLPAAAPDSPGGATTHSGTSAATPYSAGVFGTVLGSIRSALGDAKAGPKNPAGNPTAAIVAKGAPVEGSPYLADGVLTRRELTEAVFKTAEHDTSGEVFVYPPTTTGNFPAPYLIEGYGIVEPASGQRAIDVLKGVRPMPERPAEDEFFAADSALRDELWGTWSGGGESSAPTPEGTSAPVIDAMTGNPFAGVTAAQVATFDDAWKVLVDRAGPFQLDAVADAAVAMEAGGVTFFPHATGDCNAQTVVEFLDTVDSTDDVECSTFGTAGVIGADLVSWTTSEALAQPIPTGTAVDGVLYVRTQTPTSSLVTVTLTAAGRTIGQAEAFADTLGALEGWVPVPVELVTSDAATVGEDLTISVAMDLTPSWSFGLEGDHTSFFTFAITGEDGTGSGGGGEPGELRASITTPADDVEVDPTETPTLALGGTVSFPPVDAPATTGRYYPYWPETADGGCGDEVLRTTLPTTPDSGCSQTFQSLSSAGIVEFAESYPLEASGLPLRLSPNGTVTGQLVYSALAVDPARTVTLRLVATPAGSTPVVVGEQTTTATVIGLVGFGSMATFPYSFPVSGPGTGVELEALTVDVVIESGNTGTTMERDGGASFVDLPLSTAGGATEGIVEVAVDDPMFATFEVATLGARDTWGHTLDVASLSSGAHTIYVRARQGVEVSAADSVTVTVAEASGGGGSGDLGVDVRLVDAKSGRPVGNWTAATATSAGFATWTATLPVTEGTYVVESRLVGGGSTLATSAPTRIRVKK